MVKILYYIVLMSFVGIMLRHAHVKSQQVILPTKKGYFLLRMNKLYFYAGITSIIIWTIFSIFLINQPISQWRISLITWLIITGLVLLPGIFSLFWYLHHRVYFDESKITIFNIYNKKQSIYLKDIQSTETLLLTGFMKIKTREKTVKIHHHLVGFARLSRLMENERIKN